MKIGTAFGSIFKRTYPTVEPATPLVVAASLLRFHQIDAIPIFGGLEAFEPKSIKRLAIFGYSCLSSILKVDQGKYRNLLLKPCRNFALPIFSISSEERLESLLEMMVKNKFGFAWVERRDISGGLVSLRDFMQLYGLGILETDLKVHDVASSVFSMPGDSTLREALEEMFKRRYRRIAVSETNKVVSDRRILSHLFSSESVSAIRDGGPDLLKTHLSDVEGVSPPHVPGRMTIGEVSRSISQSELADECVMSESGIVTPWDTVVKVWEMGGLRIRS